jgi:hypothetical protein
MSFLLSGVDEEKPKTAVEIARPMQREIRIVI